MTCGHINITGE